MRILRYRQKRHVRAGSVWNFAGLPLTRGACAGAKL